MSTNLLEEVPVKSTHKCECVPVNMEKHPNADSLSICKVWGYTCVFRTEDWKGVEQAIYIPPDSLVDTRRPEFTFLEKDAKYFDDSTTGGPYTRVKAKKLRGIISFGLLVPTTTDKVIGQDYAAELGVAHYDPPMKSQNNRTGVITGGEVASPPEGSYPKYDVDAFMRYGQIVFKEGEPLWITEKLHGASARYLYQNGQYFCGSRTEWKKEYASAPKADKDGIIARHGEEKGNEIYNSLLEKIANWTPRKNMWWQAFEQDEGLQKFLRDHEGVAVYGEVIGCQDLPYNLKPGEVKFYAFDILKDYSWLNPEEGREYGIDLTWVPILYTAQPYKFETLLELAQRKSVLNDAQIAEGIVVKPLVERWDATVGRVQLKIINPAYYER